MWRGGVRSWRENFFQRSTFEWLACSRLSDSWEDAKVTGTRKVGGREKKEKGAPSLPSFLPFYLDFAWTTDQ